MGNKQNYKSYSEELGKKLEQNKKYIKNDENFEKNNSQFLCIIGKGGFGKV